MARFILFTARDESSGRCSPTRGGDGQGVDDKANISAFILLDNQSEVLENGPRKRYSDCCTRASVYTGLPSITLKYFASTIGPTTYFPLEVR